MFFFLSLKHFIALELPYSYGMHICNLTFFLKHIQSHDTSYVGHSHGLFLNVNVTRCRTFTWIIIWYHSHLTVYGARYLGHLHGLFYSTSRIHMLKCKLRLLLLLWVHNANSHG